MSVAYYNERWWNWCLSQDQKKDVEPMFTENVLSESQ